MPRVPARLPDRIRASARPWELACFAGLPALIVGYAAVRILRSGITERDFRIFRTAAGAVLAGHSPYPPPTPAVLAHFDKFVYPPLSALAFVPFARIPLEAGELVMLAVGIACVLASLRLLDVSDWRCYGVALLSAPVLNSILLGALTSAILLGAAAAWRYRERAALSGAFAAIAAVSKLFLWPIGLWFLATRRWRGFFAFLAVSALAVVASWAVIGFDDIRSYPHLLRVLTNVEEQRGYGIVSLTRLTGQAAEWLTLGLVVLVVAAIALARRGSDADRRSFCVAVVGALLVTPLLWLHYFSFLFIPIALYRPRLSAAWFVPLAFWLTPMTQPQGSVLRICVALAVAAGSLFCTWRQPGEAIRSHRSRQSRARAEGPEARLDEAEWAR